MTDATTLTEGPGDTEVLPEFPIYTGTVPKDVGDAGRGSIRVRPPGAAAPAAVAFDGLSAAHRLEVKRFIVVYARELLSRPGDVHYTQGSNRWDGIAHNKHQDDLFPFFGDCSSTATFLENRGLEHVHPGIHDIVNGEEWDAGFTGTIAAHGHRVHHDANIQIGDLILYGLAPDFEHVVVSLGGRKCFSHGSEAGPFTLDIDYRTDRGPTVRIF